MNKAIIQKKNFFKNLFKFYKINYKSLFNYRRAIRFNIIIQVIESIPKFRSGNVLDIGCGAGPYTIFLNKNGIKTIGIDLDEELLQRARNYLGSKYFIKASALKLPFENNSFDAVIMSEILEHLDDKKALTEAKRVLKKGSYLVVSVPTRKYHDIYNPEEHIRAGYTFKSLSNVLKSNRFEILDYFYSGFFIESLFKKIDFGLIGFNRSKKPKKNIKKNPEPKTSNIFSKGVLFGLYKYFVFPFLYLILSFDPVLKKREGLNLIVLARLK